MDTLRLIVTNKQNMPVKFADGQMKVDLYTASAITQVYDKVNDANKQKMLNMLGTKEGMVKLTNLVFGMLNKKESIGEGLEKDLVDMYKGDGEAGLADYVINHLGMTEKRFEEEFEKAGSAMQFIKNYVTKKHFPQAKTSEGKSPHKKGTAKYKKHMAAMHAESLEISEDAYNRIEAFRDSRLPEVDSMTESSIMDPETKQMIPEKDYVMKYVMSKHPEETKKLLQSGDLMDIYGGDLYNALFDYFSEEMPYGTQKGRDGDPVEYMNDELDMMGMFEENPTSKFDMYNKKPAESVGNNVFNNLQDVKRASEGEENMAQAKAMRGSQFTDKQIKMAFGILNDPKFKGGNYSGAVEVINKVAPGLADHPSVANALKRANEACGAEHSPKKKKTEGYAVLPPMPEKYVARDGLEGPIMTRSGKVVYYDNVEGKYYDPDTDMYLTYDEWKAFDPELPIKQEDEVMEKMTVTMADMKLNTKAYQNLLQGDDKYVADKELMKHILANGGREKLAASCNYESAELDRLKHLSGL